MKIFKLILTFLFGAFMVLGGVNHFIKPEMYFPFFPDFMPKETLNYATGILEIVIGIGVFIPRFRKVSTFCILILMITFLPLHIWDVFRENPAIGTQDAAMIRLPVQFLLIGWAWFIYKD